MTILIAEDDPVTLEALATCLEKDGFETLRAPDGHQAILQWQEKKPDLVCLDVMMPRVDGYEVCRRIRKSDSKIPILFLSAKNQEIDVVAGLDLGADDFIRKPFTRAEVMARIRAAARRISPSDEAFTIADLRVNPLNLSATRGGETIELTPREVSILELLSKNAGQAVSRDVFLDVCWGVDYFPDSRTLDQTIFTLRKKVEEDPSAPTIILTVRGLGYRAG